MRNSDVNLFIDLLGKNDLAVIIGQKGGAAKQVEEDPLRPSKKYLVITQISDHGQKVHYPMPLSLYETDQLHLVDRETMKLMIQRMARTLQFGNNPQRTFQSDRSPLSQRSNGFDEKTITARSFFSKDNQRHPAVKENLKLKNRLKMVH